MRGSIADPIEKGRPLLRLGVLIFHRYIFDPQLTTVVHCKDWFIQLLWACAPFILARVHDLHLIGTVGMAHFPWWAAPSVSDLRVLKGSATDRYIGERMSQEPGTPKRSSLIIKRKHIFFELGLTNLTGEN